MKQYLANTVTGIRILGSILLVLVPTFSASFYALYLLCGLTTCSTPGTSLVCSMISSS